ncbi:hypothetical protein ACQPZJ_30675 [Actinoplanes sp. CA-054009]
MRWQWGAVALILAAGGCGAQTSGDADRPVAANSAPPSAAPPSAVAASPVVPGSVTTSPVAPGSVAASPVAPGSAVADPAGAPVWRPVADGCPPAVGGERITDGPFGRDDGRDDGSTFEITCAYGTGLFVTIDIDHAHPTGTDWSVSQQTGRMGAAAGGNQVIPLPGPWSAGEIVAGLGETARPTVLAAAWWGNAYIKADVRLERPIRAAADVTAQSGQVTAVLTEVFDGLRR